LDLSRLFYAGQGIFLSPVPCPLRKGEIRLALIDRLNDSTRFNHLAQKSGNTLIGVIPQFGDALNQVSHSEQLTRVLGHGVQNDLLHRVILHLLGCGLLIARVLLGEKLNLMVDELNHIRVCLNLGHLEKSLETVALGELLNSRSRHSINSFLVF